MRITHDNNALPHSPGYSGGNQFASRGTINDMTITKNKFFRVLISLLAVLSVSVGITAVTAAPAFAEDGQSSEVADQQLRTYVQKELANNKYEVEGGGYLYGREILPPGANTDVSSDKFETLSKKGQNEFTNDLMQSMDDATSMTDNEKVQNNVGAVNTQTSTNWLKDLQNNPGMGSKILQQTLANTKPDFVSANEIYKPFSGLIGTIIALLAILMMAFLAVTLVIDLCYITIPFARGLAKGEGDDKKISMVSSEAIAAVKETEEGDGKGVALLAYLKKRIIGILVLGFCLVLLVQGEIFTFTGTMVDMTFGLMNAFLG